jgi:uncharacterized protein with HEPN domain
MRDIRDFLKDILHYALFAERIVKAKTFEDLENDETSALAFIRSMEIIGEAAKQITEENRLKYPKVPWRRWAGLRDKLTHAYFEIDLEIVFKTAQDHIPTLISTVSQMLQDSENQ